MSTPNRPLLDRLSRISPTAALLGTLAVALVGFLAPGIIGGAVLLSVAAAVAYLSRLTWSVQPPATKVARLVILTLIVGVALLKIF